MGAQSQLQHGPDRASGVAEAVYFDSGDHRLFGWLHHPSADSDANLGVVLCKPFGYEAIARIGAFAGLRSPLLPPAYQRCGLTIWGPVIRLRSIPRRIKFKPGLGMSQRRPGNCGDERACSRFVCWVYVLGRCWPWSLPRNAR